MAKSWSEISSSEDFKNETIDTQHAIRDDYFNKVILPQVLSNGDNEEEVYKDFVSTTNLPPTGTQIAKNLDEQLASGLDAVRSAPTPRNTENTYTAYGTAPNGVNAEAPRYQGAGTDEEQRKFIDIQSEKFRPEAATLVGTDAYRGLTEKQIAEKLMLAERQKLTAELAVSAITMPYGLTGSLLRRAAVGAGLGAASNAIGQAVESASLGENRFDGGELATSTLLGGILPGITDVIGRGVGKVVQMLPTETGRAARSAAEQASTELNAARTANPDYIDTVVAGGDQQAQAAVQAALRNEAGEAIATPSQALTGNTLLGRSLRGAEQRASGKGGVGDFSDNYRIQQDGTSFNRAVDEINEVPSRSVGTTQDILTSAANRTDSEVRSAYNAAKTGAQDILDSQRIKSLKLPSTKSMAAQSIAEDLEMGRNILTPSARKLLKDFGNAKIRNINDLDQWKRTLAENFEPGKIQSNEAVKNVLNSLKGEADSTIQRIAPDASSIYREADGLYQQVVPNYGKGSVLRKIVNQQNEDIASNPLLRGQNARFNTEQVGNALQSSVNRARNQLSQARNAPVDPADMTAGNFGVNTATRNLYNNVTSAQDFAQSIGRDARNSAIERATTGDNFNLGQFSRNLSNTRPSVQEADNLYRSVNPANNYPLSQDSLNEGLRRSADLFNSVRGVEPTTSKLLDTSTGVAAVTDYALTGGAATVSNIAKKFLYDNGLFDKLIGQGARSRKYIEYISVPENAERIANIMSQRAAGMSDAEIRSTFTPQALKDIVDAVEEVSRITGRLGNAVIDGGSQPTPNSVQIQPQVQAPVNSLPLQEATVNTSTVDGPATIQDALYHGMTAAETGGIENPWIRTRAKDSSTTLESTAYGPAQITGTLMQDMLTRYPEMFTPEEAEYAKNFVDQSKIMLKRPNDPVFGYGKEGVLGGNEYLRGMYESIAKKMMRQMYNNAGGDYQKFIRSWRGLHDSKYVAKVDKALNEFLDNNQIS